MTKTISATLGVTLLWSSFLFSAAQAAPIHFSSGDTFHAEHLQGLVNLTCQDGNHREYTLVQCAGDILSPGEFDYLVSDEALDATAITLHNKVGRRNVVQKRKYSSALKRSTTRYNLWVWTLTQSGLLDYGKNQVSYDLLRGGKSVGAGQFEVNVEDGGVKQCGDYSMFSGNIMDCRGQTATVCDQYFRMLNYCQ